MIGECGAGLHLAQRLDPIDVGVAGDPQRVREIRHCDARIHRRLKGHPGYEAVQALRGVGSVLGAVFVAEIGDVTRFDNPRRLRSWAGLTPRLRESDTHTHRGHIPKQGSRLLRWAAVAAVSGAVRDPRSPR